MNKPRLAAAILALALLGCQQPTRTAPGESTAWDAFVGTFLDEHAAILPNWAAGIGRHEFDGMLPDFSRAGIQRRIDHAHASRDRALAFDGASLSTAQRFERDNLVAELDDELFWLEDGARPWTNPAFYAFALDPNVYVDREYAPLAQRMRAYSAWARGMPRALAEARANLRSPMPRSYVQLARGVFGGLAGFLEKDVPGVFAPVRDPWLREEFEASNAAAAKAVREFDAWLATQEAAATDAYAMGTDKFLRMLRATEQIDMPLARLKEMGERDLERNLDALAAACSRFAPGQGIEACVAKMKARKPEEGPVAAAGKQLRELRAFVVARGVVTIPGPEIADVRPAPPYRRWNAAYLDVPGPYEKGLVSTFRIAPPDPKWSAAEQAAYIPGVRDLLFYSVHEVWPGHFLQHQYSDRAPSRVGRLFRSYAFSEGWAHYSEEMMWEMGLADGDPEVHVAQLVNALWRDVRYLSAIGLHTGGMTIAQSEAMFREKAFLDPGNARQQAARGTFDPGYGNYTLGKLMIRKLRDD